MSTFLVTWNPEKFDWDARGRPAAIRKTATGRRFKGQWSTSRRKKLIARGDRVFMLRQGPEPRGIVASGKFDSPVRPGRHWDETGKIANYADILYDTVLSDQDVLPLALLKSNIAGVHWKPQGGGVVLEPPADMKLERLWASHMGQVHPGSKQPLTPPKPRKSQGWQIDPIKRKLAEDHAQALLEKHYRRRKWKVTDTRRGNPFDAMATRGNRTLYLEAKGTETDGASVLVTSGEVRFARAQLGDCVIGIVSGIHFQPNGALDPRSGTLATHIWDPDSGQLVATAYKWGPP